MGLPRMAKLQGGWLLLAVVVGVAVAPDPTDIQPGMDFGGRRNPFAYYDRYPPPTRLPPSPPMPKEEAMAWPSAEHYSWPPAPVGGGGDDSQAAPDAKASLMVGSAEQSADDSAPLLPGLAASANAPASSAEILGPLSAAMTGPPGEESKTGSGSNAATPSTSPNSEQKAEEPQKVSSTGEDAGNSVVRVMFREKSDTKLFERPDNNMDPETSVVSFHGYHGVLVNPDDAPVSTGRAHLEDVKEVQYKPKEVSLTEDQKSAKASVNSDKGFKIVAAQKSTKPKRRLL